VIGFREITIDDAELILDWRTSSRVTRFMSSDLEYNLENQKKWIRTIGRREEYYPWIITLFERPIGLLYVENLSIQKKETHWGFYIGEEEALGFGGFIPSYFYNFAFDVLGIQTIKAEVFYNNLSVIELHLKQGYEFVPEYDRVIIKNDKSILLIAMRLNKEVFKSSKLSKLKAKLPILQWTACPIELKKSG
jgi:UDP-4-amino-4,6-dideoxy-N-acetyl-beta-L-altrosamine N-acetyltransferase